MNQYAKGANFERRLVSDFWARGWAAMRAAGSGTTALPMPDLVAIKKGRIIAVECKATRNERLSLKKEVLELKSFRDASGGEAYIAVKFYKKEPRFYDIENLLASGIYSVRMDQRFLTLDTLIEDQALL